MPAPAPHDVAQWMALELERDGTLYQDVAAASIAGNFGEEFTYVNSNGNVAISRKVLTAFKRLTEKTVVWDRGERAWRKREEFDNKTKRQAG